MTGTRDVPDPILPLVRRSVWVLLVLAGANGAYLYLLPSEAAANYAWPVKSAATAAFMGAGYLAGLVTACLAIFRARHWRSVYALVPAFILSLGAAPGGDVRPCRPLQALLAARQVLREPSEPPP